MDVLRRFVTILLNEKIRAGHGVDIRRIKPDYDENAHFPETEVIEKKNKFDLHFFKTLKLTKECEEYATLRLKMIGTGSSRNSYVLTSKKVLKVARTTYDIDQNKKEIEVHRSPEFDKYMTKIYDHDKNGLWVIADLVNPVRNLIEVQDYFGITSLRGLIRKICNVSMPAFPNRGYENTTFDLNDLKSDYSDGSKKSHEFIEFLVKAYEKGLDVSDLGSGEQWGRTTDGRIVLLDYGV